MPSRPVSRTLSPIPALLLAVGLMTASTSSHAFLCIMASMMSDVMDHNNGPQVPPIAPYPTAAYPTSAYLPPPPTHQLPPGFAFQPQPPVVMYATLPQHIQPPPPGYMIVRMPAPGRYSHPHAQGPYPATQDP